MSHTGEREREREEEMAPQWKEDDFLSCSGSKKFAREMAAVSPFADLEAAIEAARDIWFNKVDVHGWLEAFASHPDIGSKSESISQWSREEQSTAQTTATYSTLQELVEWNARYREKFGFVFLIFASGRGMPEILAELKKRYVNRPIIELEIAAQEVMKIIELRLAKLFDSRLSPSVTTQPPSSHSDRPGGHIQRTRPPITTHVLDVSRGCPASGIEVHLEKWKGAQPHPSFREGSNQWVFQGSSVTDNDGRSGPLMQIVNHLAPGFYRISFDTGGYNPSGFYPYVSIVFEIRESQMLEHFHVPILLSPFSFTTYRGS